MHCKQSRSVGTTIPILMGNKSLEDQLKKYRNTLQIKNKNLHIQDPTSEENEVYNTTITKAKLD